MRSESGRIRIVVALLNQVLERRDPHHEELVQIRMEDAEETQAFQKGISAILRFFQHPAVEFEPAGFAVQKDALDLRALIESWPPLSE